MWREDVRHLTMPNHNRYLFFIIPLEEKKVLQYKQLALSWEHISHDINGFALKEKRKMVLV